MLVQIPQLDQRRQPGFDPAHFVGELLRVGPVVDVLDVENRLSLVGERGQTRALVVFGAGLVDGEVERRRQVYRHGRAPLLVEGRTAIVVDDGIATGGTMKAVLSALRQSNPKRLVLAVPVAPADSLEELSRLADETVCLNTPEPYYAVGAHYRDFTQTSDAEVVDLLARPTI